MRCHRHFLRIGVSDTHLERLMFIALLQLDRSLWRPAYHLAELWIECQLLSNVKTEQS